MVALALVVSSGATRHAAERAAVGDVMMFGGANAETFAGCLKCADERAWPISRNIGVCMAEYRWHIGSYPNGVSIFTGAYAFPTMRYSPWNPEGEGVLIMRREERGWAYLGVMSVNPRTDRTHHPVARAALEAYERTGNVGTAHRAFCEALQVND